MIVEQKTLVPETANNLEEIAAEQLRLTRDTNEVVHSIRRMMRVSFWTKLLFWALVIILPVVFIGPITKTLQSLVPTVQVGSQSVPVFALPSSAEIEKAFRAYAAQNQPEPAPAVKSTPVIEPPIVPTATTTGSL